MFFYFMVDSSAQKVKEPDECARIEYRGKTLPERAEFAMESIISLRDMEPGTQGIITDILPECALSRRLLDLGFAEGAGIRCLFRSMFGDPTAYEICGTVIAPPCSSACRMRRKRNGGNLPFCAGGEPERWEKLAFQRADRLAPAYRKLAGENGRDGGGNMQHRRGGR